MREIIGRKPSPRVLLWEFDDQVAEGLGKLAPTVLRADPRMVRQAEWDLFVTDSSVPPNLDENLYVLAITDGFLGYPDGPTAVAAQLGWIARDKISLATEFEVGFNLPAPLESAVRRSLVPHVQELAEGHELQVVHEEGPGGGRQATGGNPEQLTHFLSTTEGLAVAGRFLRRGGKAHCWSLPPRSDPIEWTRVMLEVLGQADAKRFPVAADWTAAERWRTASERAAMEQLDQLRRERNEVMAELDDRIAAAEETLAQAKKQADISDRRLLTAQGADLLDSVVDALGDLGFEVERRDLSAEAGDKLEDLRVRDAGAPRWVAIVEVRGYRKGAQLPDLNRLHARFRLRFTKETGTEPAAMWYVVNQSFAEDPSSRQPALMSHPDEVSLFAEDDGLVLETPELFDLWTGVRIGSVSRRAARQRLRKSTGRFGAAVTPTS